MSIALFVSLECFYHFDDVGLALLGKDMPNFLVCVLYAIFACLDAMLKCFFALIFACSLCHG